VYPQTFASKTAVKIALIYGTIGALWILFSDELPAVFVSDTATMIRLQMYKGWIEVIRRSLQKDYRFLFYGKRENIT